MVRTARQQDLSAKEGPTRPVRPVRGPSPDNVWVSARAGREGVHLDVDLRGRHAGSLSTPIGVLFYVAASCLPGVLTVLGGGFAGVNGYVTLGLAAALCLLTGRMVYLIAAQPARPGRSRTRSREVEPGRVVRLYGADEVGIPSPRRE